VIFLKRFLTAGSVRVRVAAERQRRRATRVEAEALQQAGLLQPVPQHAHRPREAGPLLLL